MTTPKPLQLIGLWKVDDDDRWPHPMIFVGPPLPDKVEIVGYLRAGISVNQYMGFSFCRFEDGPPDEEMGDSDFSDGVWLWPEGLWVYVDQFDVQLPAAFLEHARAMRHQIPTELNATELAQRDVDVSFWDSWCRKTLP
jgi:hypothetical protein